MSTSPVVPAAATGGPTSSTSGIPNGQSLNNMFLQLLVAQLQNQDPTSPVDPSTFVGQLAQFSELSEVTSIYQLLQQVVPPTTGSGSGSGSASSGTSGSTSPASSNATAAASNAAAAGLAAMFPSAAAATSAAIPNFSSPAISSLAGTIQGVY